MSRSERMNPPKGAVRLRSHRAASTCPSACKNSSCAMGEPQAALSHRLWFRPPSCWQATVAESTLLRLRTRLLHMDGWTAQRLPDSSKVGSTIARKARREAWRSPRSLGLSHGNSLVLVRRARHGCARTMQLSTFWQVRSHFVLERLRTSSSSLLPLSTPNFLLPRLRYRL